MRRFFSTNNKQVLLSLLTGADAGIATISFNRLDRKNAIGNVFLNELTSHLVTIKNNKHLRVLIINSKVPKTFCAGADLKERLEMTPQEASKFVSSLRSTFSLLATLPIPTISIINGSALGGGLEIAMATDFRIAGIQTILGLPETKLAIIPGAGGTQRLPRLVGVSKAKELIFTGRRIDGGEAERIGLVDYFVDGDGEKKGFELAREILPQGPIALRVAKRAIDLGVDMTIEDGLEVEEDCYKEVLVSKDRIEGLLSFREKRKAVFIGE